MRKVEHVGSGNVWLAVVVERNVVAGDVAIGSNDDVLAWIPHKELLAGVGHGVKLVDVACFARATARCPE